MSPLGPAAGQGRPKDCSTSSSDPIMEGPCADSVEKREPASDLAIVVVDSLKRLTPTGRLEKQTHALQHNGVYSIISSAVASNVFGTLRPSALTVLALITSSNLVGCMTGRSAGFSPLRIRPT